jgi:polyphenol oxidase
MHEDLLAHCFTTRIGGVSSNECESLNLGFNRKDSRENVIENFKRVAEVLDINHENMVFSNQVHDNKVKAVDEKDLGKGIVRDSDILGYDGLITDRPGVALVTFYADCVPVLFFDPVKKVIAASHSGWRGTVKEIASVTVKKMEEEYNCCLKNIKVAIGPSLGQCCFEVGEEVYIEFVQTLPWCERYCKKRDNEKWYIDLQSIILTTLTHSGISEENIFKANVCTKCNRDIFFSHRGDMGKTGSLAAVMQIK